MGKDKKDEKVVEPPPKPSTKKGKNNKQKTEPPPMVETKPPASVKDSGRGKGKAGGAKGNKKVQAAEEKIIVEKKDTKSNKKSQWHVPVASTTRKAGSKRKASEAVETAVP